MTCKPYFNTDALTLLLLNFSDTDALSELQEQQSSFLHSNDARIRIGRNYRQNNRIVDMENTEAKLRVRMGFSDAHYAGNLVVKNSIL